MYDELPGAAGTTGASCPDGVRSMAFAVPYVDGHMIP
jgi:hypothetical protein